MPIKLLGDDPARVLYSKRGSCLALIDSKEFSKKGIVKNGEGLPSRLKRRGYQSKKFDEMYDNRRFRHAIYPPTEFAHFRSPDLQC